MAPSGIIPLTWLKIAKPSLAASIIVLSQSTLCWIGFGYMPSQSHLARSFLAFLTTVLAKVVKVAFELLERFLSFLISSSCFYSSMMQLSVTLVDHFKTTLHLFFGMFLLTNL